MSGIIVGVDGSGHCQHVLDWAMKEAALRQVPQSVTVKAVHGFPVEELIDAGRDQQGQSSSPRPWAVP
jgi:hypothetical protein